nr:uncharacterized protein LOC129262428 [Lytechinus pictus]
MAMEGITPDPGKLLATIKEGKSVSKGEMLKAYHTEKEILPEVAKIWDVNERTIVRQIERLRDKLAAMKKNFNRAGTKEKIAAFMEEPYPIPTPSSTHPTLKPLTDSCSNCKQLLKISDSNKLDYQDKLEQITKNRDITTKELRKKLTKARGRVRELASELREGGRKDLLRKFQRAKKSLQHYREQFKLLSSKAKKLEAGKKNAERKAEKYRQKNIRLQRKLFSTIRSGTCNSALPPQQDSDVVHLLEKIETLQDEIKRLTVPIPTKEGKQFNTSVREASFYLQDIGVPEHRTSEAIRIVSETINGRQIGCLPSSSTQHRMASEMKVLSKSQVRESLKDKNNLTIKYDGTTKGRVGHLTEVEVASKEKTFLVGVSQQVGGAADEYVRTIEEACDAISPDILCNKTTNTMTDRCITNDSVDKKLEKEKNIHLNKFRCAMHPLDTIAKEVNKALKKMDDVHDRTRKMPFNKGGECNVQAFIRVGSKLFNSESCGDSTDLRSFLKGRGHQKVLPRWVGNRFDILFSSAGLLYHIGPSIVEYFRTVTKPSNDLHRSFVNAWNDKNICHLRCLGLMGHLVTHPWMEAASQDLNILEMNANYYSAVQVLERWAGNPSSLLRDQHTIFSSDPMRDDIFQSLVSPPYEDQMEEPMRGMLMAALEVTKRQLQSQLPGGVFWEPSV